MTLQHLRPASLDAVASRHALIHVPLAGQQALFPRIRSWLRPGRYPRAGADAWAGRVRAQLRALGVRPGPRGPRHRPAGRWQSLTATERAVSLLVADGLTNGAVARRLYISPHTVNTQLRHVFAKLGVPNRVALTAAVHHSIE